MSIEEIRAKQVSEQSKAIGQRREAESIVRIGDRIPLTGRHEVLDADGGISQSGVKVYNAQEQYGDRVLPFPRTDGTIALDSEKGSITRPPTAFPHCPGYLAGQLFNCEVPKKKKPGQVWILYAYQGRFYVGGHQRDGVLVYDPIPPNMPVFDRNNGASMNQFSFQVTGNYDAVATYGCVWGDSDGWEANYSIRYPKKLCFATDDGIKQYDNFQRNNNYIYLGGWLGKGYFIEQYDFARQGSNGGSGGVSFSDSWKNAIVDFEAFTTNTGSYSGSVTRSGTSGTTVIREVEIVNSMETYPAPYTSKNRNYKRSINRDVSPIGTPPSGPNFGYERTINTSEMLFRDRSSALFYTKNDDWGVGSFTNNVSNINLSTIVVGTSGSRENVLLTLPPRSHSRGTPYEAKLFGIDRYDAVQGYNLRHYKYNNPSVTLVDNADNWRALRTTNSNSEVTCSVKVYSITNKESLVDGQHDLVQLTCWGVPFDAQIIDVAAWVP